MALSAAIVLAAGEGTRMRSNKPKVLHAFAGKTFLNRVMDSVAALNPDTLAVVVHFQAERVAEAARSYDEQVTIVNQDDIPGTGRLPEPVRPAPHLGPVEPQRHHPAVPVTGHRCPAGAHRTGSGDHARCHRWP